MRVYRGLKDGGRCSNYRGILKYGHSDLLDWEAMYSFFLYRGFARLMD